MALPLLKLLQSISLLSMTVLDSVDMLIRMYCLALLYSWKGLQVAQFDWKRPFEALTKLNIKIAPGNAQYGPDVNSMRGNNKLTKLEGLHTQDLAVTCNTTLDNKNLDYL